MKIQVWNDFVCPYCYVGHKQLQDVIEEFDEPIEVEMMAHAIRRDEEYQNMNMKEVIVDKIGKSQAETDQKYNKLEDKANRLGLQLNQDDLKYSRSHGAQKLYQYAKEVGRADEVADAIFHGYFVDGLEIETSIGLRPIANQLGLNDLALADILESDLYDKRINEEKRMGKSVGVSTVPHVRISEDTDVIGIFTKDDLREAIKKNI